MKLSRHRASSFLLGSLAAVSLAGTTAQAGDAIDGSPITRAANRCAEFGAGFVDMGNGVCSRISGHVRVELRDGGAWTSSGTSSATLRSDGLGMLPGAGDSHHLRVRSGLESFNPFQ